MTFTRQTWCKINNYQSTFITGPGDDSVATNYGLYAIYTPKTTFDAAEAICRILGAHLVALETPEEYENLKPIVPDNAKYWIGGRDVKLTGTFTWISTGVKLSETFTKWAPGRPFLISSYPHHRCICWYLSQWNDMPCTSPNGFICEYWLTSLNNWNC